jgi:hypothetical protein
VVDPLSGGFGDEVVEGAGGDPAVPEVGVERLGVVGAQQQGRALLPAVTEAVDRRQLMGATGAAQLVEHAAATDGLELARVADEVVRAFVVYGLLLTGRCRRAHRRGHRQP